MKAEGFHHIALQLECLDSLQLTTFDHLVTILKCQRCLITINAEVCVIIAESEALVDNIIIILLSCEYVRLSNLM